MASDHAATAVGQLGWAEICARFPDQWVVLDNIAWVNDTDFEFTGADVLATFETRRAASPTMKVLIESRRRAGCFWTGELVPKSFTSINHPIAR